MGLLKWIVIIVAVIVLISWLKGCWTGRGSLPFIGLSPLTGSWRKMKNYMGGLGGLFLEEEDVTNAASTISVVTPGPVPVEHNTLLNVPSSWDFTDLQGSGKREKMVRRILETFFQQPFPSVRPNWLTNPQTGRNLEIDCYNEDLNLAVEHQGRQHYEAGGLHKTREDFLKQVYRDRIKKEILLERGLNYLIVPYTVPQEQLPTYLLQMLEQLGY